MTQEIALKALEYGLGYSKERLEISYFGGEPLLEYQLLQTISKKAANECKQRGISLVQNITTNGVLLDRAKLEWLHSNRVFLNISIDGNESMHNTHRVFASGEGSFSQAKDAILLAKEFYKINEFKTISVITPQNIEHLVDSVKFLYEELGVENLYLLVDYFANWNKHPKLYEEIYYNLGLYLISIYKSGKSINIEPFDSKIKMHIDRSSYVCQFGEFKQAVAPSGRLYPCERLIGNDSGALSIGDVENGIDFKKFQDILQSRGNKNKECQDCEYKSRCNNSCGCTNYYLTGDIAVAGASLCFFEKLTIDVSDFIATTLFREQNSIFLDKFYK
jgi:uncharacterized protein